MMGVCRCSNCGKELRWKFGEMEAHLGLTVVNRDCGECHQRVEKGRHLNFCGPDCLKAFVDSEKWEKVIKELA